MTSRPSSVSSQLLTVLAVSFGPFSVGLSKGYSSPALASLAASTMSVTDQQSSWLASLSLLGALLGGLLSSLVLRAGRKNSLLLVSLPFSASWMLTVFATTVEMMFCTAFMAGLCSAIVIVVSQVYISEIACAHLRGRLSSCLKIFSHAGLLTSYLLGAWLDWRQLALVCGAAPLMLLVTVQYAPETPSYLMYCGKVEQARASLQWLRGDLVDVSEELAVIQINIDQTRAEAAHRPLCSVILPRLVKPLLLTCSVMFFTRFSGVIAFNFYAVPIFSQVLTDLNPHLGAVVSALVQLVSSLVSGVLSDKLGRRPLLVTSGLVMTVALAGFGAFTRYRPEESSEVSTDYIPLLTVLLFQCAFSAGVQPVSWLLLGEIFPLEFRALGTAITTAFSYLCAFLGVKTYVDLKELCGLGGTFWTYAVITSLGVLFYWAAVPEMKEEPLEEMRGRSKSGRSDGAGLKSELCDSAFNGNRGESLGVDNTRWL